MTNTSHIGLVLWCYREIERTERAVQGAETGLEGWVVWVGFLDLGMSRTWAPLSCLARWQGPPYSEPSPQRLWPIAAQHGESGGPG